MVTQGRYIFWDWGAGRLDLPWKLFKIVIDGWCRELEWDDPLKRVEGIWGGIAKTKGHLRDYMETKHSRNFLKYIHI